MLGNRSEQINALSGQRADPAGAVNERSYAVSMLLERVGEFSTQVAGFINDNPNLNKVLEQLRTISDILVDRKFDLVDVLSTLSKFTASLAEAIASGPFFKVMLVNLLPYVDPAAVRRRRLQEARHRPGGVLAQRGPARVPVPGSERHRASRTVHPPPAPDAAGRHAGQSRSRRDRRARRARTRRRPKDFRGPGNPLPCAAPVDRPVRIEPVLGTADRLQHLPDVLTSPPNPNGPGFTPGVPAAAFPGQLPPDMGGVPAPLPPASAGRTHRAGRPAAVPRRPDFTPGIAPLPPALDGPPPPPGPGPAPGPAGTPVLPGNPPFLPPGSQNG